MSKENTAKNKGGIRQLISNNMVVIMFIILCSICMILSKASPSYVLKEVATRFGRNTCLVLALIIPCLAGLGLNFGIVVGATAAQIAVFFIGHWGFTGIGGFMLCVLMSTPLAIIFGILLGRLYNKTKGAEMITGLVAGFFTDGLYRLFVLYIIGGVIPFDDPNLLDRGFGLRNAYDLTHINMKYALDDISFFIVMRIAFILLALSVITKWIYNKKQNITVPVRLNIIKLIGCAVGFGASFVLSSIPYFQIVLGGTRLYLCDAVCLAAIVILVYYVIKLIWEKIQHKQVNWKKYIWIGIGCVAAYAITYVPFVYEAIRDVELSSASYGVILLFCIINNWILDTKLGMDMRTVGQSRMVATSAGIDVNKTRIIATCISTVLAAWGQLVFLQNLGTFNTVQQQSFVGLYAVAAILVGGASIQKATNKQAVLGVVLFHFLFVVAPLAATKAVGDSAISEYIRMFISYGIISVALAMHTIKTQKEKINLMQ